MIPWAPLPVMLACFGLVVATEFALDGKQFDLSHFVCYAFMIVMLVIIGACGIVAAKRWNADA